MKERINTYNGTNTTFCIASFFLEGSQPIWISLLSSSESNKFYSQMIPTISEETINSFCGLKNISSFPVHTIRTSSMEFDREHSLRVEVRNVFLFLHCWGVKFSRCVGILLYGPIFLSIHSFSWNERTALIYHQHNLIWLQINTRER